MLDIYFSINNREEVIRLPVVPAEFKVQSPQSNETWQSISQGEMKMIGLMGLKSLQIESFFPLRQYPFVRDTTYRGWEYVLKIEAWRVRRLPVRLIIIGTTINMPVTIDQFEYGVGPGSGDVKYTLTLSEYRFVQVPKVGG